MLLELVIFVVLVLVLLTVHRSDIEKGGEGVPFIGQYLDELHNILEGVAKNRNKKKRVGEADAAVKAPAQTSSEPSPMCDPTQLGSTNPAQSAESAQNAKEFEKFEPTMSKPNSKNRHHKTHRSRFDSAVNGATGNQ